MYVYRIALEKYAGALVASGVAARWNSKDVKVIYTASTRALACLENVVHRSAIGLQANFRTMIIEIPEGLPVTTVKKNQLPADWHLFENYPHTQDLGDAWISKGETAVLQVPSAIIPEEHNYLLNPAHQDFKKVKLIRTEKFEFDPRIKN
ncbi:MAG: RES family NAD+ phosphorylase [Bacteroidota bacterium]|nr:RES family NAD+ phosphorylase [Flavisolibacter sp.]MDQ3842922.1 RES family NAD+ phosphorylase [Bacteroidota bacterium]MBD0284800.1 RES family NAD+ phosphorylase [Flavisolibacter sp.]MBD0295035.1 RES family NAD+ phosphorylase [Flavisolibacter sp.]MBD0352614.1 RES family NAD+ phosphorylase [Flavisolibacter sp.]